MLPLPSHTPLPVPRRMGQYPRAALLPAAMSEAAAVSKQAQRDQVGEGVRRVGVGGEAGEQRKWRVEEEKEGKKMT